MTLSLIPLAVFIIGLVLFFLKPMNTKAARIGEILMLAGAIGFCLSGGHTFSIH